MQILTWVAGPVVRRAKSLALLVILGSITQSAAAYELTLVRDLDQSYGYVPSGVPPSSPVGIFANAFSTGALVSYSLYLDSEGQSGIFALSAGLTFFSDVLTYRPDLSETEDYYPLYSPSVGKAIPSTWLVPTSNPPSVSVLAQPPGISRVDFEFAANGLTPTAATATNLYLGRLVFEVTDYFDPTHPSWDEAFFPTVFGLDHPGSFLLADHGAGIIDVGPQVGTSIVWAPEPSTSLLVGLGLVFLARANRRRAEPKH